MTTYFKMSIDSALEFFKRVGEKEKELNRVITEEERIEIMSKMIEDKLINNVVTTKRTSEEIAKDFAKQGNKVLYLKHKEEN